MKESENYKDIDIEYIMIQHANYSKNPEIHKFVVNVLSTHRFMHSSHFNELMSLPFDDPMKKTDFLKDIMEKLKLKSKKFEQK